MHVYGPGGLEIDGKPEQEPKEITGKPLDDLCPKRGAHVDNFTKKYVPHKESLKNYDKYKGTLDVTGGHVFLSFDKTDVAPLQTMLMGKIQKNVGMNITVLQCVSGGGQAKGVQVSTDGGAVSVHGIFLFANVTKIPQGGPLPIKTSECMASCKCSGVWYDDATLEDTLPNVQMTDDDGNTVESSEDSFNTPKKMFDMAWERVMTAKKSG